MGKSRYEVIIVGGGPAGLSAGIELAKRGIAVLLVEQRKEIGLPVQCGEAVSKLFMDESGFGADLSWVVSTVDRLRLVMPSEAAVTLSQKGYCIKRDAFDIWLLERYMKLGGDAHLGEKILGAEEKQDGISLRTTRGVYEAGYAVAADGPISRIALSLGLRRSARCISAIQYKFRANGDYEPGTLNVYLNEEVTGGYFWIFPRGEEISVGVGGSDRLILRDALWHFCRKHGFDSSERISSHGGLSPDCGFGGRLSSERVVICGDAAGLVHPASKGGIHLAVHSGRAAGRAVAERIRAGSPLSSYADEIGRIAVFKQLYFDRLRSAVSLTNRKYDLLGEVAADSVSGRLLIGRILIHPAVWPLLPRCFGLYRAYIRTARWIW